VYRRQEIGLGDPCQWAVVGVVFEQFLDRVVFLRAQARLIVEMEPGLAMASAKGRVSGVYSKGSLTTECPIPVCDEDWEVGRAEIRRHHRGKAILRVPAGEQQGR